MSSVSVQPLISLRPFKGIDATSADPDMIQGRARSGQSANPYRVPMALVAERGRTNLVNITIGGVGSTVQDIFEYVNATNDVRLLGTTLLSSSYSRFYLDVESLSQSLIDFGGTTDSTFFNQAVQFNATMYDNAGRQYSALNPGNTYLWHYPAPDAVTYGYAVAPGSGTLPAATYYIAFTQVVQGPNGAFTQETSPTGPNATAISSFSVTSTGTQSIVLNGTFTGTNTDGSTFTTNYYRYSTLTGVWYLVTNLASNVTYTDNATDQSIAQNVQLDMNRDVPPVTPTNLGAIFRHQSRMCCFLMQNNANTNNQPQLQFWFSNLGRPWEFDEESIVFGGNVILVGDGEVVASNYDYSVTYGDWPQMGVSYASAALLWTSRKMYIVYGSDQTSYVVLKLFDTGSRSPQSLVVGPIGTTQLVFALYSDRMVKITDGSTLTIISEPIRAILESLTDADITGAIGFYAHQTYYLSFPVAGVTYGYNTLSSEWVGPLPYAALSATGVQSNPSLFGDTTQIGGVFAIRPNSNEIDQWFSGGDLDLNTPQTVEWQSANTSSGSFGLEKEFMFVVVNAPYQPGVTAIVALIVDGQTWTYEFNLAETDSTGRQITSHIKDVPSDLVRGYTASLLVSFQTTTGLSAPAQIWACEAYGVIGRAFIPTEM